MAMARSICTRWRNKIHSVASSLRLSKAPQSLSR
ncbi:MAG: hypothetical protein HY231_06720 [Acidobacteria bacterium]|nr:hypothetical protein [Acidobacteriota bacterium]